MSSVAQQTATLIDILPENEQALAYELVKRLVLAWDPDYTKLTPSEAAALGEAQNGDYIDDTDIDWNELSKYV